MDKKNLTKDFEKIRKIYSKQYIFSDPVQFPRRFHNFQDKEVSAFISAMFAYGRVQNIISFLEKVHTFLGESPHLGILEGRKWKNGGYRFQSEEDVRNFFLALKKIYKKYGTLEKLFSLQKGDTELKLKNFIMEIRKEFKNITKGLNHLLTIPDKKNVAKRLRLFLRWVVREDDGIDLGLWKSLKPSELVVPVDTHLARIAIELKIVNKKSLDLDFAIQITDFLKKISPDDPLKYDFSLVREGILTNFKKAMIDNKKLNNYNSF